MRCAVSPKKPIGRIESWSYRSPYCIIQQHRDDNNLPIQCSSHSSVNIILPHNIIYLASMKTWNASLASAGSIISNIRPISSHLSIKSESSILYYCCVNITLKIDFFVVRQPTCHIFGYKSLVKYSSLTVLCKQPFFKRYFYVSFDILISMGRTVLIFYWRILWCLKSVPDTFNVC